MQIDAAPITFNNTGIDNGAVCATEHKLADVILNDAGSLVDEVNSVET